eukprot:TRINITY_DN6023_c0_g2_i3.p2 TRINITY_DN6023_c0_g2~~TRINITY_DN6023_c0_g2_i3.p2  ORF type:complete len:144 (-),score=45.70 TRINITY_DN6023_c0_g2_i3:42-473(-)
MSNNALGSEGQDETDLKNQAEVQNEAEERKNNVMEARRQLEEAMGDVMDEAENKSPSEGQKKEKQVRMFDQYLQSSGLNLAFEVILAEILTKKIQPDQVFVYAAMRFRQFDEDLKKIAAGKVLFQANCIECRELTSTKPITLR